MKWEERRYEENNKGLERETRRGRGKTGGEERMGSPKEVREKMREEGREWERRGKKAESIIST